MKIFKPEHVDNEAVLTALSANTLHCAPYIASMREGYSDYLKKSGRPGEMLPLDLPEAVAKELYEFYQAERVRDNLKWIGTYRQAKDLSHCPLCGNPGPSSLEHYLPRSPYSEFTVFSWNLIPSCGLCNGRRSNTKNGQGQKIPLIHPYFDDAIFGRPMLSAKVVPPFEGVRFEPIAIGDFGGENLERVKRQIASCVKVDRFNTYLVSKWNIWRGKVGSYRSLRRVRAELNIELSATVGPTGNNSWDSAFCRAVLSDADALTWLADNPIDVAHAPVPLRDNQ